MISFKTKIKIAVNDNSLTLKFDNFYEFQSVVKDSSLPMAITRSQNFDVMIVPSPHCFHTLFHFFMFHYCSCLASVLVSLQNYSCLFVWFWPYMLVITSTRTIVTFSMEQGYQQIVCCYPNSKIRATKTCYLYRTKFPGLIIITLCIEKLICDLPLKQP